MGSWGAALELLLQVLPLLHKSHVIDFKQVFLCNTFFISQILSVTEPGGVTSFVLHASTIKHAGVESRLPKERAAQIAFIVRYATHL